MLHMKITVPVNDREEISLYSPYADSLLIRIPHLSCVFDKETDVDSLIQYSLEQGKEVILSIDKIMHPDDLPEATLFLEKYKEKPVLFLCSDLGVLNIAKRLGMENRLIYDPQTMVTNHYDLKCYYDLGFHAVSMSDEIPLSMVRDCYQKTGADIFYQVFGYHLMFYSYRQLISLYGDKIHRNIDTEQGAFELKEQMRKARLPIIQNENGTFVYRGYLLSLLKEMKSLKFLSYAYFESLFLKKEQFLNVLTTYKKYLDDELTLVQAEEKIASINLIIEDGFTYKDTAYTKGDAKDE